MEMDVVPLGTGFGAEAFGAVEGLRSSFPLTEVTLQDEFVSNADAVYTETTRTSNTVSCTASTITRSLTSFILKTLETSRTV